jgi:hypothetical protein
MLVVIVRLKEYEYSICRLRTNMLKGAMDLYLGKK